MTSKPPVADPPPLTKSAFARRMGVSEATVREWCAHGMPLRPEGRSVRRAPAIGSRPASIRRGRRDQRGTVSDLRARKLLAEAELLEMDRRKRADELVERAAIERAAEARGCKS
jgi:hypothetical protein